MAALAIASIPRLRLLGGQPASTAAAILERLRGAGPPKAAQVLIIVTKPAAGLTPAEARSVTKAGTATGGQPRSALPTVPVRPSGRVALARGLRPGPLQGPVLPQMALVCSLARQARSTAAG